MTEIEIMRARMKGGGGCQKTKQLDFTHSRDFARAWT